MRYGMKPQGLLERVAVWLGRVPAPAVDVLVPLVQARAIMAAVRLGIVTALDSRAGSVAELSSRLGLDCGGTALVLRVLSAAGYVSCRRGSYRLTPLARRTLLPGGAQPCSDLVRFNYSQWNFVRELESTLTRGKGMDFHEITPGESPEWELYQRAMLQMARPVAPIIAARLPVKPGAARLVDVGGSHGLVGAMICRRHPPLRSTVLELPEAVPVAARLAREIGIDDVVEHRAGDARTASFESGIDVFVLSNFVHHFSPEETVDLLLRARRAMRPGATLCIWDHEARSEMEPPELVADALALYFRITSSSRCFSARELCGFASAAGFEGPQVVRSVLAPARVLVHARAGS